MGVGGRIGNAWWFGSRCEGMTKQSDGRDGCERWDEPDRTKNLFDARRDQNLSLKLPCRAE